MPKLYKLKYVIKEIKVKELQVQFKNRSCPFLF